MKNYKDYPWIISDKDVYTSPKPTKTVYSPSFVFYTSMFSTILRSNLKTKFKMYDRYNWTASSNDIIKGLEKAGVELHIDGMLNISSFEGSAIFIANHMSTMETMILPSLIQPMKSCVYVIKEELVNYPFFGPIAKARFPILVGRKNPREDLMKVIQQSADRLKSGRSIIIFPQKTRTEFFEPQNFNSLGVKIAKKNDVHIVPVALLTDAWSNGKMIKEYGRIIPSKKVRLSFGKPFKVEGNGAEEHERVLSFIREKLIEWGREDLIKA